MPSLFGRYWTRAELARHVGDMAQIASIRPVRLEGGRASGVHALDFVCGDGLRFTLLPDLCMDIPHLEYRGVPLVWSSRNGIVGPAYFRPEGSEWLRSFFGGLLTTCGLTQVGQPCDDSGERLGLHGRIGSTPAEQVAYSASWDGDEYVLSASGVMRETKIFGADLHLSRRIWAYAGSRTIHLHDHVENLGSQSSPFMILYHCNAGFPLLQEGSRLLVSDLDVRPKDDRSRDGLPEHVHYGPPRRGYEELNFWHDVRLDADGHCQAAIVNEALQLPFARGLGLAVRWRKDQLWNLVQWKMEGEGDYVTAIEPANCHTLGRCAERDLGTLEHIAPGEVREFDVEFSVLVGIQEIAAFEQSLPRQVTV
jgi:hypothetical protein